MTEHRGVALGYVTGGRVTSKFHLCVVAAMEAHRDLIGSHLAVEGAYIFRNRNNVVREFLTTSMEWLWFVDDDIIFPSEVLTVLLGQADPDTRPIVGACYFGPAPAQDNWLPMWTEQRDGDRYAMVEHVESDRLYQLTAIGMGCTLIHRRVLEAMDKLRGEPHEPEPWFGHDIIPAGAGYRRAGEDITFCRRAAALGFTIHGYGYAVGHIKTDVHGWECHRGGGRPL